MTMTSNVLLLLLSAWCSYLSSAQRALSVAELDTLIAELVTLFDANPEVVANSVRLGFHDCAGQMEGDLARQTPSICDGCIDLGNPENAGMETIAVVALETVYAIWEPLGLSRADFWAAAATTAVRFAQSNDDNADNRNDSLPVMSYYFGRIDCSASPDADVDNGQYALPYKHFPSPLAGWDDTFGWFEANFGFNVRQTVAIIGAHTLGFLRQEFAGFGTDSWVQQQDVLDNAFYVDLFRNWNQVQVGRNELDLFEWIRGTGTFLNSDISLLRRIDDFVNQQTGQVSCAFNQNGRNPCPTNTETSGISQEYMNSNQLWLTDFAAAFDAMVRMGYNGNALTPITSTVAVEAANNNNNNNNDNNNNNNNNNRRGSSSEDGGRGQREDAFIIDLQISPKAFYLLFAVLSMAVVSCLMWNCFTMQKMNNVVYHEQLTKNVAY